jgi:hypothetical protein
MKKLILLLALAVSGLSGKDKDFIFPGENTENAWTNDIFAGAIASATIHNIKEFYQYLFDNPSFTYHFEYHTMEYPPNVPSFYNRKDYAQLERALSIISAHTRADLWEGKNTNKIVQKPNADLFTVLASDITEEKRAEILLTLYQSESKASSECTALVNNLRSSLHIIEVISKTPSGRLYNQEYQEIIKQLKQDIQTISTVIIT